MNENGRYHLGYFPRKYFTNQYERLVYDGCLMLLELGESMETQPLFWKEFFFDFFSLNMPVWSRKHFW